VDPAEPPPIVTVAEPASAAGQGAPGDEPRERPGRAGQPLELGATTFLLAGVASSGVVGLSAFLVDPLSSDVMLRISGAGGEAPASDLPTAWAAARLDTCYEATGRYASGQGLRLGLCAGADVGVTLIGPGSQPGEPHNHQTMAFVDLGPSVELGAEVGPILTVLLRGGLGINLARDTFVSGSGERVDPSVGTERAEVGLSWKLP
jgi:hypothetical protein